MVSSSAPTVKEYLDELPDDRRKALSAVRKVIRKTGKKLDMGKSCVRFKTIDQLPVELIGQVIGGSTLEEFLSVHQSVKSK